MTLLQIFGIALMLFCQPATSAITGPMPESGQPTEPEITPSRLHTPPPVPLVKGCPTYCAKEYFHEVPEIWETDFRRVMSNLTPLLGFYDIDIIAWPSSNQPPTLYGRALERGQYISGRRNPKGEERTLMVLEIDLNELKNKHAHRLSVIAHEYFHVYQRQRNPALNHGFSIKWLIEGSAAVFESMYLNEFEQVSDYHLTAQLRHAKSEDFGPRMEHYDNPEINYGTSTAMVLYACRNTGFQSMIDFWNRHPTNENWKTLFQDVFGIGVEQFYADGKSAKLDQLKLTDMGSLKAIQF